MRAVSLVEVPTAILSRQIAGTRGSSLIVNLPGKPRRSAPASTRSSPPFPTASISSAARLETNPEFCEAFRPKREAGPGGP